MRNTTSNSEGKHNKYESDQENIRFSRLYFANFREVVARILILIAQALMLGVIVIVSASLSKIATEQLPIPAVFNQFGVADGVFRGITIVIAIGGIILSLTFVIPTLIVRNIRVLKITGILFNSLGLLFVLIMLALAIVAYLFIPVRFNLPGVILAGICTMFIILGSILMWTAAISQQNKIKNAITESMNFTTTNLKVNGEKYEK